MFGFCVKTLIRKAIKNVMQLLQEFPISGLCYFTMHDPTMHDSCINYVSLCMSRTDWTGKQSTLRWKVEKFHWVTQIGLDSLPLKLQSDKLNVAPFQLCPTCFVASVILFVKRIDLCRPCIICMLLCLWFQKELFATVLEIRF